MIVLGVPPAGRAVNTTANRQRHVNARRIGFEGFVVQSARFAGVPAMTSAHCKRSDRSLWVRSGPASRIETLLWVEPTVEVTSRYRLVTNYGRRGSIRHEANPN